MSDDEFKPVSHDGKAALAKAMKRPGFAEAWQASADFYEAVAIGYLEIASGDVVPLEPLDELLAKYRRHSQSRP